MLDQKRNDSDSIVQASELLVLLIDDGMESALIEEMDRFIHMSLT